MDWKKSIKWVGIVAAGAIAQALVIIGGLSPQLRAEYAGGEWRVSLEFQPKEEVGQTARTIGQGTRCGGCTDGKTPMTALVPENKVWTTLSANPTMFWYMPKTTAEKAELVVMDEMRKEVYQTTFVIPGKPGIVKVKLPDRAALKKGKTYTWYMELMCDTEDRTGNDYISGEIKRTEVSKAMKKKLAQAAPLEQASLYAKAGIWNETLEIAAQLRNSNPEEWEELLKSVKLEAYASEPFAETEVEK